MSDMQQQGVFKASVSGYKVAFPVNQSRAGAGIWIPVTL
jgi:hypothetical protein